MRPTKFLVRTAQSYLCSYQGPRLWPGRRQILSNPFMSRAKDPLKKDAAAACNKPCASQPSVEQSGTSCSTPFPSFLPSFLPPVFRVSTCNKIACLVEYPPPPSPFGFTPSFLPSLDRGTRSWRWCRGERERERKRERERVMTKGTRFGSVLRRPSYVACIVKRTSGSKRRVLATELICSLCIQ